MAAYAKIAPFLFAIIATILTVVSMSQRPKTGIPAANQ